MVVMRGNEFVVVFSIVKDGFANISLRLQKSKLKRPITDACIHSVTQHTFLQGFGHRFVGIGIGGGWKLYSFTHMA